MRSRELGEAPGQAPSTAAGAGTPDAAVCAVGSTAAAAGSTGGSGGTAAVPRQGHTGESAPVAAGPSVSRFDSGEGDPLLRLNEATAATAGAPVAAAAEEGGTGLELYIH